ncbi:MAG: bifunctional phosphoglucose/phosphomannose isomerase [Candidatus Wildermuthbacteria bacterium]|nr:bifunctional phosphoglucose/phosphomannose isomerase [Candidatus Wildermuthbacteria bacterium]
MGEVIRHFPKQFSYTPVIQNALALKRKNSFIVAGMGGSHLAADILQACSPGLDIIVCADYDFSLIPDQVVENSLVVLVSYSGNTEEPLSVFHEAEKRKLPLAVISMGGKLLDLAKEQKIPYVQIPDTGIQPRSAVGFMFMALASVAGEAQILQAAAALAETLDVSGARDQGKELGKKLAGKIPVVYASSRNAAIAYNWKIRFNETSKIPAFFNVFPELNHNEMNGFDVTDKTKGLSSNIAFVFLKDRNDHAQVQKRMEVTALMYEQRGFLVHVLLAEGSTRLHQIFSSLLLADWTSYYLALDYHVNPDEVPMVEEFKKRIA